MAERVTIILEVRNRQFRQGIRAASGDLRLLNNQITQSAISLAGFGTGAFAIVAVARAVAELTDEFVRYEIRLKALSGSQEAAAFNNRFLVEQADRFGLSLRAQREAFSRILPLQTAGLVTGEQLRNVFERLNVAGAATGATVDSLRRVYLGLSQAIATNVVRAEEYNQINENLPGLFGAIEAATGRAAGSIRQLVVSQQLSSQTLLELIQTRIPAFEKAAVDAAQTASSEWRRFVAEVQALAINVGEDVEGRLRGILRQATDIVAQLNEAQRTNFQAPQQFESLFINRDDPELLRLINAGLIQIQSTADTIDLTDFGIQNFQQYQDLLAKLDDEQRKNASSVKVLKDEVNGLDFTYRGSLRAQEAYLDRVREIIEANKDLPGSFVQQITDPFGDAIGNALDYKRALEDVIIATDDIRVKSRQVDEAFARVQDLNAGARGEQLRSDLVLLNRALQKAQTDEAQFLAESVRENERWARTISRLRSQALSAEIDALPERQREARIESEAQLAAARAYLLNIRAANAETTEQKQALIDQSDEQFDIAQSLGRQISDSKEQASLFNRLVRLKTQQRDVETQIRKETQETAKVDQGNLEKQIKDARKELELLARASGTVRENLRDTEIKFALNLETAEDEFIRLQRALNKGIADLDIDTKPLSAELQNVIGEIRAQQLGIPFKPELDDQALRDIRQNLNENYLDAKNEIEKNPISIIFDASQVKSSLQLIAEAFREFTATITATVNVQGSDAVLFNRGGFVPGFGNGDTVPAWLTPGEFVLTAEAVRAIGLDQLYRMNAMRIGSTPKLPSVPATTVYNNSQHFANGGAVQPGEREQLQPININIAGGRPIALRGTRGNARQLAQLLQEIERG